MPFNELHRRDSWPPTIVRLHNDEDRDDTSEIDNDPFSFFLTSPQDVDLDLDLDDEEDLSAGIESSTKRAPVRSISPSQIQRYSPPTTTTTDDDDANEAEEEAFQLGLAMPLSLKDFSRAHTSDGRASRSSLRPEDKVTTGLGIQMQMPARRGRASVRLTSVRGRGRGQTRSLSARRPRSWRAPSPDLGSITEERESEEEGIENLDGEVGMGISASAPATSYLPQVPMQSEEQGKKKKRVHWAL